MHEIERKIDQLDQLQERYDRGRASGEISEPIPFLEKSEKPAPED